MHMLRITNVQVIHYHLHCGRVVSYQKTSMGYQVKHLPLTRFAPSSLQFIKTGVLVHFYFVRAIPAWLTLTYKEVYLDEELIIVLDRSLFLSLGKAHALLLDISILLCPHKAVAWASPACLTYHKCSFRHTNERKLMTNMRYGNEYHSTQFRAPRINDLAVAPGNLRRFQGDGYAISFAYISSRV